jgi:hypothetical protein
MTEDHKRLLAVFEVRVRDLMALCDQQKRRIDELTAALSLKDEELRQAKDMITGRFSPITFLELLLKNDIEGFQIYDLSSTHKSKKVCRNTRCAFFFSLTIKIGSFF